MNERWRSEDFGKLSDAVMWLVATETQILRVHRAIGDSLDVRMRGARSDEELQRVVSVSIEAHFTCVAVRHLSTALARLKRRKSVPLLTPETTKAATLTRHLLEHWDHSRRQFENADTPKTAAAADYVDAYPGTSPWAHSWSTESGYSIGSLSIGVLSAELAEIRPPLMRAYRECSTALGIRPVPRALHDRRSPPIAYETPTDAAVAGWSAAPEIVWRWQEDPLAFVLLRLDDELWPEGFPWLVRCARDEEGWREVGGGNGGTFLPTLSEEVGIHVSVVYADASVRRVRWAWTDGFVAEAPPTRGFAVALRQHAKSDESPTVEIVK